MRPHAHRPYKGVPSHRAGFAACLVLAGCSADPSAVPAVAVDDTQEVADAGPVMGNVDEIKPMLEALRASHRNFCDVVRQCYPTLNDDDAFCLFPHGEGHLGYGSPWPPEQGDDCYAIPYGEQPETVRALLDCYQIATDDVGSCFGSCPEDGSGCEEAREAAMSDCLLSHYFQLSQPTIDAFVDCNSAS